MTWHLDGRLVVGGMVCLLSLVFAATGCSEEKRRGHRGDAGEAGADASAGAGDPGSGGSASAGRSTGATGSGATGSGATGSGATGSGATGSGATGSGATGSGATGSGATGSGATGGTSSDAGGGGDAGDSAASGGTSSGGSGECNDCTGVCGNGRRETGEACDDGNTDNEDGCSSACAVEPDYTCSGAVCDGDNGACVLRLPATFRDFNGAATAGGHPDFEPVLTNMSAISGLVETMLDDDGKPVATPEATPAYGNIQSQATFAEWYRSNPIPGEIVLWDDGAGGFVNRWGANGEQWIGYPDLTGLTFCNYSCAECGTPPPGFVCLEQCAPLGSTFACIVQQLSYDGNPLFFPIDSSSGVLTDSRGEGKVPEAYGYAGWPWETAVATSLGISTPVPTATAPFPSATHNFSFTTEVRFWFRYDDTLTQTLSFLGDDDVWVFVNGHLAIDLGGWHVPLDATLDFVGGVVRSYTTTDLSTTTPSVVTREEPVSAFGLEPGGVYEVAVFHAERQADGSSFKLGLRGFDAVRSTCGRN